MDGIASRPTGLQVQCIHHNVSNINTVDIAWGILRGQTERRIDEPNYHTTYDRVVPNTNYTVTVSAITRHRKTGEAAIGKCTMPVTVPETINRIMWTQLRLSSDKSVKRSALKSQEEAASNLTEHTSDNLAVNITTTDFNGKTELKPVLEVFDGEIDINSNYTGYLEIIVRNESSLLRAYSNYFEVITPGLEAGQMVIVDDVAVILNIVIVFLAILIGVVLVGLLILCLLYRMSAKILAMQKK
ncbi:Tyrosine-protein phosphatase 69D [Eumeta japonica]|uniref:Tyrosine-protein phosphatase 69D n=1 Tax=Eumeta variegata TaxID=151549 RepID=A0A4C2A4R0_EUMVA|nr:Tyrosine-protein phosphatase 69D [Eumeta japonica]